MANLSPATMDMKSDAAALSSSYLRFLSIFFLLLTSLGPVQALASSERAENRSIEVTIECGELEVPALVAVSESGSSSPSISRKVRLPWHGTMGTLSPRDANWNVNVQADGCWSQKFAWDGVSSVDFVLHPIGRVTGVFSIPDRKSEGWSMPKTLRALFFQTDSSEPGEADRVSVSCEIESSTWECGLPSGTHDLRLQADSYSPLFLWQQEIEPGSTVDVGDWELCPGSAVEGWVTLPGSEASVDVLARRMQTGAFQDPQEEEKKRLLKWSSTADERGSFAIEGLTPGRYKIVASSGALESEAMEIVLSSEGVRLALSQPLDLRQVGTLRLVLDPALDFWDQPWHVDLLKSTDDLAELETAASARVSYSGVWESPPMPSGSYVLRVRDSTGGSWLHRPMQTIGEVEELFIDLEVVEVRGQLSFGNEPLEGKVLFGTGSPKIVMIADSSGRFEGSLPEEKEWQIEVEMEDGSIAVEPLEVAVPDGKTYAELEISLPNTRVYGTVSHQGEPIDALVLALRGDLDIRERKANERLRVDLNALTGDDGEYDLVGIPPGDFQIRASRGKLESDWSKISLEDDSELELNFELEEKKSRKGLLLHRGVPLSGAKIHFVVPGGLAGSTVSSTDGIFEIALRKEVQVVDLLIHPPIGGLSFRRFSVDPGSSSPQIIEISSTAGELVYRTPSTPASVEFQGVQFPFSSLLRVLGPEIYAHPDGGLAIPNVETGRWQFCPSAPRGGAPCQAKEVLAGSSTVFSITLDKDQT